MCEKVQAILRESDGWGLLYRRVELLCDCEIRMDSQCVEPNLACWGKGVKRRSAPNSNIAVTYVPSENQTWQPLNPFQWTEKDEDIYYNKCGIFQPCDWWLPSITALPSSVLLLQELKDLDDQYLAIEKEYEKAVQVPWKSWAIGDRLGWRINRFWKKQRKGAAP